MKALSSRRAKACAISAKVKKRVAERDAIDGWPCCILCGSNKALPEAHFIPRSKGGLGIEENIMTLCRPCHYMFDNGDRETKERMRRRAKAYLKARYPNWSEERLVYGNKIERRDEPDTDGGFPEQN